MRAQNDAGNVERVFVSIKLPVVSPGSVTGLELAAYGNALTVNWSAPEAGGAPDGLGSHRCAPGRACGDIALSVVDEPIAGGVRSAMVESARWSISPRTGWYGIASLRWRVMLASRSAQTHTLVKPYAFVS